VYPGGGWINGEASSLDGRRREQLYSRFFVWLETRQDGRWKVLDTTWRPKGVSANGKAYIPQR
jgi:hypothetical protein